MGLDEAALAKLAAKARAVNPFGGHNRYGNHDSDDSDDDGMLTDDENVTSPLDAVDPFVSFAEMMAATASADAAKFAALNAGMDQTMGGNFSAAAEAAILKGAVPQSRVDAAAQPPHTPSAASSYAFGCLPSFLLTRTHTLSWRPPRLATGVRGT